MIEIQKMLTTRRLTIITPEFSQPLLNQKIDISGKVKQFGLVGAGICSYSCTFKTDILYPKELMTVEVDVDNSKCSKRIEKYKVKLLRRTQVFHVKTSKAIYTNDQIALADQNNMQNDGNEVFTGNKS